MLGLVELRFLPVSFCADADFEEGSVEQHLISNILNGPAVVLGGSGLDDSDAIKAAADAFPGVRSYVVRQWMLLDVLVPPGWERYFAGLGHCSTVLYARTVVNDSAALLEGGSDFLTGPQLDFKDCFFACAQGLFVLAGLGSRKKISLPALLALSKEVDNSVWSEGLTEPDIACFAARNEHSGADSIWGQSDQ